MDLHIGNDDSIHSSTLEVACPPPGYGGKKVQEIPETRFCTTYTGSAVALERAGVDLDVCIISKNSSALEVACPPPGQEKFQESSAGHHSPTYIGASGVALESAVVDL